MRLRTLSTALLSLGVLLLIALFWQFLDVYFVLDGREVDPSPAQERRYVWTASACVAVMFAGAAMATLASRKVLGPLGGIGVLLAIIAAVVFSVPTGRWIPDPAVQQPPDNYQPCYSGSNDCGPGG